MDHPLDAPAPTAERRMMMFVLFIGMVVFLVLVCLAVFTAFIVLMGISWLIQWVCDAVSDLMRKENEHERDSF